MSKNRSVLVRIGAPGRVLGPILRLGALGLAAAAALATSSGEANDEEDMPGGNVTGGETQVGDDHVDFTEVPEPTTVVVGGAEFLLTGDGRHVITLRTEWYGGGGVQTELRSRRLLIIDTQSGLVVGELDVSEAGRFGLVLLADVQRFVLVRRDAEGWITGLDTVRLPGMIVEAAYAPQTLGNQVRLSPSGRYAAIWSAYQLGWPIWNLHLTVKDLVVGIEDRQTGAPPRQFTTSYGVADVIAAPDGSAMYVALSTRDYSQEPSNYHLEIIRLSLGPNLPSNSLLLPQAGHASSAEIKGGSSLRLSPDQETLTFDGCSFVTGTCLARWYVVDVADLSLRGDLRAAGASAFTPDGDRAIGWDGQSSQEGKIWVTTCVTDDYPSSQTDHWLLDVNLDTLQASVMDLPMLAPYYFVTRDGAYVVASVENCSQEELWAVDLTSGEPSLIRYAGHGLHQFTVMEDHRTIYSVDRGVLERIDLEAKESMPTAYPGWASRINRLPASSRLVLGDPDLLVFTLWDAETQEQIWRLDLSAGALSPPPPMAPNDIGAAPLPTAASRVDGFWRSGGAALGGRALRSAPRELRPRIAGGALGEEFTL